MVYDDGGEAGGGETHFYENDGITTMIVGDASNGEGVMWIDSSTSSDMHGGGTWSWTNGRLDPSPQFDVHGGRPKGGFHHLATTKTWSYSGDSATYTAVAGYQGVVIDVATAIASGLSGGAVEQKDCQTYEAVHITVWAGGASVTSVEPDWGSC